MAKKRFTFADAKDKIKDLEGQLELLTQLNTEDHYYTKKENKVIKFYKTWAYIGPVVGLIIGYILG